MARVQLEENCQVYFSLFFLGKPFDLFFQNLMEELVDQTAERGVQLEKARQVYLVVV